MTLRFSAQHRYFLLQQNTIPRSQQIIFIKQENIETKEFFIDQQSRNESW
jgi:hypothetical protein